jgi:hypothetical protein
LKTLGDLYNYTNYRLLEDQLDSIDDVIEFFEECQQIITGRFPIEAPKLNITLTSNEIPKPDDFQSLRKIIIDGHEVRPVDIWGNIIELPKNYNSGEATLYYYKKPAALDKNNLNQIPDIDSRYLPIMGKFAAEMYYLSDEDPENRAEYRTAFIESLNRLEDVSNNRHKSNYTNLW